jgi:hypothetical protein
MTYSRMDKRRIDRKARAKLGLLKSDASDYADFMDNCVADMQDMGMDDEDAQMECQSIWDEEGD